MHNRTSRMVDRAREMQIGTEQANNRIDLHVKRHNDFSAHILICLFRAPLLVAPFIFLCATNVLHFFCLFRIPCNFLPFLFLLNSPLISMCYISYGSLLALLRIPFNLVCFIKWHARLLFRSSSFSAIFLMNSSLDSTVGLKFQRYLIVHINFIVAMTKRENFVIHLVDEWILIYSPKMESLDSIRKKNWCCLFWLRIRSLFVTLATTILVRCAV